MMVKEADEGMFESFYEDWSLTFTGVVMDEDNLQYAVDFLNGHGGKVKPDVTVWHFTGKMMNDHYGLTGGNAYPDDLNFVAIMLSDIGDVHAISLPRFEIGGRWFTDIVDNNAMHEQEMRERA